MKKLKYLWANHRLLLIGFSISTLVTLFFLARFFVSVIYWQTHQDLDIKPWMPIRYIAHSYQVNQRWLLKQTGLPVADYRARLTIRRAAAESGVSYDEMKDRLMAAIAAKRSAEND